MTRAAAIAIKMANIYWTLNICQESSKSCASIWVLTHFIPTTEIDAINIYITYEESETEDSLTCSGSHSWTGNPTIRTHTVWSSQVAQFVKRLTLTQVRIPEFQDGALIRIAAQWGVRFSLWHYPLLWCLSLTFSNK